MRRPVLLFLGGLVATAGFLAWMTLAWSAFSDADAVTPQSDEGGRMMLWALTGTVLMIAGMIVLHFAQDAEG